MTVAAVHRFSSFKPWDNLAREEALFDAMVEPTLILYVNSPCIVLGKHQNPLQEVRFEEADRRRIPLLRRASGGGTVWHDEGNLNWSILVPKTGYDRGRVTRAVAEAQALLGFALEAGDKGDLFLAGKKVSGAAFLHRRDRVLHHGTLLCQARLDDLHGVLGATGTLIEWVGVSSRPMPVANLGVEVDRACNALIEAFSARGAPVADGVGDTTFEAEVAARSERLASSAWLWDQTPPFTWEGQTRQGFLRVQVRDGKIQDAWDDRSLNMSKMVGKRFFDPEFFEYIRIKEAP